MLRATSLLKPPLQLPSCHSSVGRIFATRPHVTSSTGIGHHHNRILNGKNRLVQYNTYFRTPSPPNSMRHPKFNRCCCSFGPHQRDRDKVLISTVDPTVRGVSTMGKELLDKHEKEAFVSTVEVDEEDCIEETESQSHFDIDMLHSDCQTFEEEQGNQSTPSPMEDHKATVKNGKSKLVPDLPVRSKLQNGKLTHWEMSKVISAVEGLVFLGMTDEAVKTISNYLRLGHVFSIDTYNQLLQCAVNACDDVVTRVVMNMINSQDIAYNPHTYCILLQRAERNHDLEAVLSLLNDFTDNGFTLDSIFESCPLTSEQGNLVLNAMKRVDQQFCPPSSTKFTNFKSVDLLKDLYSPNSEVSFDEVLGNAQNAHVTESQDSLDVGMLSKMDISEFVQEQLDRERNYYCTVKSVETTSGVSKRLIKHQKLYSRIHQKWKEKFVLELKRLIQLKESGGDGIDPAVHNIINPYLRLLEPEQFADIVLNETIPALATQQTGMSTAYLCRNIGEMIYNVFCLRYKEQQGSHSAISKIYDSYGKYAVDSSNLSSVLPREMWTFCESKCHMYGIDKGSASLWPLHIKLVVSGALLDILKKVALLDDKGNPNEDQNQVPAIQHVRQFSKGRLQGIVKLHPFVCRLFKSQTAEKGQLAIESFKIPMVIPPKPWTSIYNGGFLLRSSPLVRTVLDEYGHSDLKRASEKGDLNAIFDALNYLSSCPWKINKRILDIMISIFNDKGDPKLEITCPVMTGLPKVRRDINISEEDKAEHSKERKKLKKAHHELFALRMGQLYHLSVASLLKDRIFWLPYNLDFRGRVYTIPPYCTHTGSDLNRGLMLFGKGKCLGNDGLDWLKIHLINLHGAKKKSSLQERLEFANDMIGEIIDSAEKPLTGNQWWKTADEPWQTLATCLEIRDALNSPDPRKYISYLPVHQDGSCNGLQHYAALGRDQYGAEKVNVSSSSHPQDVYTEVALLVEKQRALDAASGHEMAILLDGKVSRKVVKQTVMTIVYGVTHIGGRLQIERQLKDVSDFDSYQLFKASDYLVTRVFSSIGQLFKSARKIQDWLTKSAVDISSAGQPVSWVTPLGLPIVQPYHKKTEERTITPLQKMVTKSHYDQTKKPDTRKQRGGFPPNYVHSLDSTHMLLTALHCQSNDILFASVHDSFWTHAADVPVMNTICREQFYRLHSEPLLQNLQSFFQDKYGSLKYKGRKNGPPLTFDDLPESGSFDLKEVLKSPYFFS